MSKYIQSIDSKRGVILNPQRSKREPKLDTCPFCPGNEHLTPPAIQDWPVRVFPNKYPILPHHEVIVHSPDHSPDIPDLPLSQISLIIKTYIARYKALKKYGTIIIFNNSAGKSGATLSHPHSQILALPPEIKTSIPPLEPVKGEALKSVAFKNSNFIAYCPAFSQFPYETWIRPIKAIKGLAFYKIKGEVLKSLAKILQLTLRKIVSIPKLPDSPYHPDIAYNFYLIPDSPFYLRIIPRLTTLAGFEFATGLTVNPVPPIKAAKTLASPAPPRKTTQ